MMAATAQAILHATATIINYWSVCLPGADGVCPMHRKGYTPSTIFAPPQARVVHSFIVAQLTHKGYLVLQFIQSLHLPLASPSNGRIVYY